MSHKTTTSETQAATINSQTVSHKTMQQQIIIKNIFRRNTTLSNNNISNNNNNNNNNNKTMAIIVASNNTTTTFDDTSIDTERSATTVEELVTDYLHYLQGSFEGHLVGLSSKGTPQQHQWATFWLQEEARVETHHDEALAMLGDAKQTRIRSYLDNRKERILNFLWSLCRDAMDEDDQTSVEHVFSAFVEREEQLMKLYLVGYIQSSSKQ
jgi:hypothetical protein